MQEQKKKKALSLVDLCVDVAISNVRYLGDVGETDFHLLERILPHCSMDQLIHIEKKTVGRDLSPVTDELWKGFFKREFGESMMNVITEKMKKRKVSFKWKELYEAKLKEVAQRENKLVAQLRQSYQKEDAKRQSRQIRLCTKVPPSSKRSFFGGSGPGCNLTNVKSNIMKKSKVEFLKSREVQNIAAMKKISVHRNNGASTSGSISGNNSASSSQHSKFFGKRL